MRALVLTLVLSAPVSALACGMPSSYRLEKAIVDIDAALEEPVAKPAQPVQKAPVEKAPAQKPEVPVTPSVIAEATPQS